MKILQQKSLKVFRNKQLSKQGDIDPITLERITNGQMDHDHKKFFVRKVLSRESNMFLGKIENFYHRFIAYKQLPITLPEILVNVANYLREDYSKNPIYPSEISKILRRYSRMNLKNQNKIFKFKGTKKEKTKAYRKFLMKPENIYKV